MKSKPSTKLYIFQANVYATKLGSQFGTTINITVEASNEKDALIKAKEKFNIYVDRLSINHNNKFEYNNLKLV